MKKAALLCCTLFVFFACKKSETNNTVLLPVVPDTLGTGWTKLAGIAQNNPVTDVFFVDANTGYATNASGVFKTSNGGTNWSQIFTGTDLINIAAAGSNACFFAQNNNIYHTANQGATVETYGYNIPLTPSFKDGQFASSAVCYAFSNLYCWKSVNGGARFDTLYNFADNNSNGAVVTSFTDEQHGWVVRNAQVYRTSNGGQSWTFVKTLNQPYAGAVHFINTTTGYVSDGSTLYGTSNGGSTWFDASGAASFSFITDIHFFDALNGYCVAGSRIYQTSNGGQSWTKVVAMGNGVGLYEVFFLDAQHGWACGERGTILKFTL